MAFFSVVTQEFVLNKEIDWTSGEVPKDEPQCGFNEEKCQYEPGKWKST